jgi:poly-gamma-glutamate capsule biosynthesis protein CapA/YwtB (metallophosphatase superfamily)
MSPVLIGFAGDVVVNRDNPRDAFGKVREILAVPDIVFANLEGAYTDDPRPVPNTPFVLSSPAHNLDVYAAAGFDVLSLANNHILDVGPEAMLETRSRLREQGVKTCGAGASSAAAREPAILVAEGVTIAFLAYSSIFPVGYEAEHDKPGLAPMRAYNFWREPFPGVHVPGIRPLITTVPDRADLDRLTEDIKRAEAVADLVIVSFHWGDQYQQFQLTDHETRTARYCIDHGADMVIGHHHHAPRGMEWYAGKPIMYGLGHFVFDCRLDPDEAEQVIESDVGRYFQQIGFATGSDELADMPDHYHLSLLAWAVVEHGEINDIGFLPCGLAPNGTVLPYQPDSPAGKELVGYLERCNRIPALNGLITAQGAPQIAGFNTLRVVPG